MIRAGWIVVRAVHIAMIRAVQIVAGTVHIAMIRAVQVVVRAVHIAMIRAVQVVVRAVHIAMIRAVQVVVRAVHIAVIRAVQVVAGTVHIAMPHGLRMLVKHSTRIAVDGGMEPTMRPHPRSMPVRVPRRRCHPVAMRRVVVVPMIPRCRLPSRYKTQRRQCSYREYRHTGRRVPIHRTPIRITENRETARIIARIRPRHTRVVPIRRHAIGPIRRIIPGWRYRA